MIRIGLLQIGTLGVFLVGTVLAACAGPGDDATTDEDLTGDQKRYANSETESDSANAARDAGTSSTGTAPVENDAGVAPEAAADAAACAYTCTVSIGSPTTTTCASPVSPDLSVHGQFKAQIDLTGRSELELSFEVCNPQGWTVHLADDALGNGYGGGGLGSGVNTAEAQLLERALSVYANNRSSPPSTLLFSEASYVPPYGCTTRVLRVKDQRIVSDSPALDWPSPYGLRLPSATEPGDAVWHLGLNRIVGAYGSPRTGRGVTHATLCLR